MPGIQKTVSLNRNESEQPGASCSQETDDLVKCGVNTAVGGSGDNTEREATAPVL